METNFNFKSQSCTSKEQSERLLALGLKKETADCYWFYCDIAKKWKCTILSSTQVFKDYPTTVIPAWSLDRLKELIPESIDGIEKNDEWYPVKSIVYTKNTVELIDLDAGDSFKSFNEGSSYDSIISCIEWLIKEAIKILKEE